MLSQTDKVNAAWKRIETWYATNFPDYQLPAGATPADIIALEAHLGLTLPDEFKASLERHNGVERWTKCTSLQSIEAIKAEWNLWVESLDRGIFDGIVGNENDSLQRCWFNRSWIPFGGYGFCLDMNPGEQGRAGQVIFMHHDNGPSGPNFPDFAEYLEDTADSIEAGRYVVDHGYLKLVN